MLGVGRSRGTESRSVIGMESELRLFLNLTPRKLEKRLLTGYVLVILFGEASGRYSLWRLGCGFDSRQTTGFFRCKKTGIVIFRGVYIR